MRFILGILKESTNSFEGQEHGETVIKLVRRHPFPIFVKFAVSVVAAGVPLLLATMYSPILVQYGLGQLVLFLVSVWILLLWLVFFYHLTMFSLDVWIITNHRIIDSTQHGFFNRTISEAHLTRVQDTSVQINGLIQSWLHIGDVDIQSAGTEERFMFEQVPHPEEIKNIIMRMAGKQNTGGNL